MEYIDNKENIEEDSGYSNTWILIIMSIIAMALSASVLFVPQISEITLCYIACGALVGCGIYQIGKFFLTKAYKSLKEYGFASGAMLVILGCCGIANAHALAEALNILFGLVALFIGIVLLQCTVQLKTIKNGFWAFVGILTFIILAASVCVLADFNWLIGGIASFASWLLLGAGLCNVISFPLVAFILHRNRKKEEAENEVQYVPAPVKVKPLIEEKEEEPETLALPNKKVVFISADEEKEETVETIETTETVVEEPVMEQEESVVENNEVI